MRRIAVIASGWHFPLGFYESMMKQVVPEGWMVDYYCVSHRDPIHAKVEKENYKFKRGIRGKLDKILYKGIADKEIIERLGWNYKEYPNTIGDWGNTNQWLDEHDYREYDMILATHDDNLIIHDRLFADIIEDGNFENWDILTNSPGMPQGTIRGSFEFFKRNVLDVIGGKFDISSITLTREGKNYASQDILELYDWNNLTPMMQKVIEDNKLRVAILSPAYRVSCYCIEGERGYISNTHGINTHFEDEGFKFLKANKII